MVSVNLPEMFVADAISCFALEFQLTFTPGEGRARRQVQIVQGRIEDGTIFPNMSISIADQTEKAVKRIQKDLKKFLAQQMILIKNDFDLVVASQGENNQVMVQQNQNAIEDLLEEAKVYQEQYSALLESIATLD